MKICSVDLCSKPHHAKGYCRKHYERVSRKGTFKLSNIPIISKPSLSLQRQKQSQIEEAFFQARKVVKPHRNSLEFREEKL